jgi:PAS domain S-box-containing protein
MKHLNNNKTFYPSLPLKIVMYLTLISLIPLSILSYFSYNISYTGIKESSNVYISHYVAEKKKRVNLFVKDIEKIINNIEGLSEIKELLTTDNLMLEKISVRSQIKGALSNFALSEGVISVDIFSLKGIVAHVGTTLRHDNQIEPLKKDLFQKTVDNAKVIYWAGIQDNIHIDMHQKKVLSAVKAIKYINKTGNIIKQELFGFILLQFDLNTFYNEFYEKNRFGGYTILFDQHAQIIYHPNRKKIGLKADPYIQDILHSISANEVYSNRAMDEFVIMNQIANKNWFIAHFVSDATYKTRIRPIFFYFMILFILCLILISVTVFFFYKTIISPIRLITNQFRKLRYSDADTQLRIENKYQDEIAELVHWFNNFIESMIEKDQAEIALKESEERFKALHNASFGGIAIHDKGVILECNKGMSTITGYSYNELIGMNGLLLISDDTREKVVHNINTGYEKSYEAKGVRKNGEVYPLRLEARNIPYKNKDVRVVEFRDITEIIHAADEKENLEKQLRQAQKMEAVGRLAGGVAHDFNNMLSVIIGHSEMALDQTDLSMPIYSDLKEIISAGKRSADLTRQLLAFARKQTVTPKILDINKKVNEMINMLKRLIGEDIELVWNKNNNYFPIKIDPSQLDQVLANLCLNARDAIVGGGKIWIQTNKINADNKFCETHAEAVPGVYICLMVSDNGKGMDKITLSSIFEPFFTTKSTGKGTGLGLATVHGIVKQNNGFIDVYSELGKGTSFKIYIPYQLEKEPAQTFSNQTQESPQGQETILLVEDEPSILKMIEKMLTRLGYKVLSANTPGEAINLAKNQFNQIHLLMTDVVMPEMNGRDLAETIILLNPEIKYLFMSGYTADVIADHGVLDEHVSFIQKPFSHKELADMIRQVMDTT